MRSYVGKKNGQHTYRLPTIPHGGINKTAAKMGTVHSILTKEQAEAFDLIRWVWAVAKLPADSRRFNFYVTYWDVPGKIARAKAAGTFDNSVANCPPIDPAWLRFAPAAFAAWRENQEKSKTPIPTAPKSTAKPPRRTRDPRPQPIESTYGPINEIDPTLPPGIYRRVPPRQAKR